MVVIYFDDIGSEKICPKLRAHQNHSVANLKPAPVIIYDFYDNCKFNQSFHKTFCPTFLLKARRARSFYNPPKISLCDICNGAEECAADCEQEEINVV